jgi:hypothetical protein
MGGGHGLRLPALFVSCWLCVCEGRQQEEGERRKERKKERKEKKKKKKKMKKFSSAYHPQTDGQTERVNQVVEDILRAYALKDSKSWDKCLPYAEFSYNNSYQKSLKMSPFEVLYGCKCRTPLFWNEPEENQVFEPEILREAEKQVHIVRENLQLAQSRQKSYTDHRGRAWGVGGLQGGRC